MVSRRTVLAAVAAQWLALAGPVFAQGTTTARPPLVVTSCGQSSDAFTVSLFSRRARLEHSYDPVLAPEKVPGVRTLVIVIGGSVKGLAEAGTDQRTELQRMARVIEEAKRHGVTLVGVHVGGEARRGSISDPFIDLVVPRVDRLVVTEAGNRDGLFTRASRQHGIPLTIVAQPAEVVRELRALVPPAPVRQP